MGLNVFQYMYSEFWVSCHMVAAKVSGHSCVGIVLDVKEVTLEPVNYSIAVCPTYFILHLLHPKQ